VRRRVPRGMTVGITVLGLSISLAVSCARVVEDGASDAGSGTAGSGSAGGPPCETGADCDSSSYCRADDEDCGAGHCRARPDKPGWDPSGTYCGCDGMLYRGVDRARFQGIDVGSNQRCKIDPGKLFRCGPQLLCGGRIGPGYDVCCPTDGGACPLPPDEIRTSVCIHYGPAKGSKVYWACGYDNPPFDCSGSHALDFCNVCEDELSSKCVPSYHDYTSVTCHQECLGELVLECHP
jgi:hypothetical protein